MIKTYVLRYICIYIYFEVYWQPTWWISFYLLVIIESKDQIPDVQVYYAAERLADDKWGDIYEVQYTFSSVAINVQHEAKGVSAIYNGEDPRLDIYSYHLCTRMYTSMYTEVLYSGGCAFIRVRNHSTKPVRCRFLTIASGGTLLLRRNWSIA